MKQFTVHLYLFHFCVKSVNFDTYKCIYCSEDAVVFQTTVFTKIFGQPALAASKNPDETAPDQGLYCCQIFKTSFDKGV